MDWKKKLSSRKFWALIAAFITAVLVIFGASQGSIEKVAAIITSGGAVIAYILAEGNIDAQAVKKEQPPG
jgi:hypothetical protein